MLKVLSLLIFIALPSIADAARYAVAVKPVPVFSTPSFSSLFGGKNGGLATDACGQLRELEFMALPGSVFRVDGEIGTDVLKVTTAEYPHPSKSGYFIDRRLVELRDDPPPERARKLPPRDEVLRRLKDSVGAKYVWGGNVRDGLPFLRELYPPKHDAAGWTLAGLDCSGLLYAATDGWTPRNTSALVRYGHAVPVAGKKPAELATLLQPLDLIVWNGHVMIVIDGGKVIESALSCRKPETGGVRIRDLRQEIEKLMQRRKAVDEWPEGGGRYFVVRRWYKAGQ